MSFTAKLLFDDKEIMIGLDVIIESTKDTDILDWIVNPNISKQIEISISPRMLNGKGRKLFFIDAHCVNYTENFDGKNEQPMTTSLHITSAGMREGTTEFSEYWRVTYPNTAPITESEDDTEPRVVEYYITDTDHKRIEETIIGETILLNIDTRNLIGEKLTINLDDQTVDFKYNGEVLVNDTLTDYEIGSNLEKIELEVIKQQN